MELSASLFDRGVVVNPRVEIARPIGTLFITPETGGLLLASADTYTQTCEMSRFEQRAGSLKGCLPTILALFDRDPRPR